MTEKCKYLFQACRKTIIVEVREVRLVATVYCHTNGLFWPFYGVSEKIKAQLPLTNGSKTQILKCKQSQIKDHIRDDFEDKKFFIFEFLNL